jgi:hypothetical protein
VNFFHQTLPNKRHVWLPFFMTKQIPTFVYGPHFFCPAQQNIGNLRTSPTSTHFLLCCLAEVWSPLDTLENRRKQRVFDSEILNHSKWGWHDRPCIMMLFWKIRPSLKLSYRQWSVCFLIKPRFWGLYYAVQISERHENE